jgi:hypothetical protein
MADYKTNINLQHKKVSFNKTGQQNPDGGAFRRMRLIAVRF